MSLIDVALYLASGLTAFGLGATCSSTLSKILRSVA